MHVPRYRLRVLGGLTLEQPSDVKQAPPVQGRRLALLALLARGTPGVRRETLSSHLWPESDPDRARNALNQAVFSLRRDLGESILLVSGGELRLNFEQVTVDVMEFERLLGAGSLDRAVDLYAGPFLAGFFLPDAGDFERWMESERSQVTRRYIDALSRIATTAEAAGNATRASDAWRRAVEAEPLSARFVVRLMKSLAASGDTTAAIQHARTHAELVRRELEVEPDPMVVAAESEIRNGGGTNGMVSPPVSGVDQPPADPSLGVDLHTRPPEPPQQAAGVTASALPTYTRRRGRWTRPVSIAVMVAGLALAAATVRVWQEARAERVRPVLASARVLIAPFHNASGDSALGIFGTMVSDGVSSAIARTGFVDVVDWRRLLTEVSPDSIGGQRRARVVSVTHSDSNAGAARVAELARETGAGAVVWGRVDRRGDSVRFETWILRGDAQTIVRTLEPVTSPIGNPLPAIERVTRNVAGAFAALSDPRLAAWSGQGTHVPPYDAYAHYVRGLEATARRDINGAITHFDRAVVADSDFVEAMLWLTESLQVTPNGRQRADSLINVLDRRRDQLAPYDQAVLDTKIGWFSGDRELMYRASVRMTQLAPGSNDAHWAHGSTAVMTNRFGEAIDAFAHVDLTRGWMKDWDYYLRWPSLAFHARGEYDRELSQIREHRERFPRSIDLCLLELRALAAMGRSRAIDRLSAACNALPTAVQYQAALTHHFIAKELRSHGHDEAAIAHADSAAASFRQRSELEPNNVGLRQGMAFSYLEGRRWTEARALYEALDKTTPRSLPGILTSIAIAAARQGDVTTADSLLRRVSADTSMRPSWIALYKARISSSLGREDQALEALRDAVRAGLAPMEIIHFDVGLERLHGTRGWKELMRERR